MNKEELMKLVSNLSEEDAEALSGLWEEELLAEKEKFQKEFDAEKIREEAKEEALMSAREEFQKEKRDNAIQSALENANSKSIKALKALIDLDKVEFEDGKLTGLSEQIETLKKECDFLFFVEAEDKPKFTKGIVPFESKADLSGLSYKERLKLYREMPELYKRLAK